MAPLTILSDSEISALLHSLQREDILRLQESLGDALHHYSTSTEAEENGCSSTYQPMRTALQRSNGATTLFMPASSNDGIGVKIVTLSAAPEKNAGGSSSGLPSLSSLSLSSSSAHSADNSPVTPDFLVDTEVSKASNGSHESKTTPRGSLTLLDNLGTPRALLNAEEITAFRTALASTMLFKRRTNVHDLSVFGAGKQAYWHIRLALILRGSEIHHLNVINRGFESAHALIEKLYTPQKPAVSFPATAAHTSTATDLPRPKIAIITPAHNEYARLLKSTMRASSVIFCTTPSVAPLFPAEFLTSTEGRKKGRYIAAIGSYKPHMVELHPDIIRQAVAPQHTNHHHKHAKQGGAIVVDSVEACLKEAGEIIQSGISGNEVVEIGELVMLKREAEKKRIERSMSSASTLSSSGIEINDASSKASEKEDEMVDRGLRDWLEKGNVIYKSVGLGLMDVVVGMDLVKLADDRGYGTRIENF